MAESSKKIVWHGDPAGTHRGHINLGRTALRTPSSAFRFLWFLTFPVWHPTFTAVTRVQIPSGTPNLFKNLRERRQFCAGTKRNIGNNYPIEMPRNVHVCKGLQVLVRGHKKAHFKHQDPTLGVSRVRINPTTSL